MNHPDTQRLEARVRVLLRGDKKPLDSDKQLRAIARRITTQAQLDDVLGDVHDPTLRAKLQQALGPLVSFDPGNPVGLSKELRT